MATDGDAGDEGVSERETESPWSYSSEDDHDDQSDGGPPPKPADASPISEAAAIDLFKQHVGPNVVKRGGEAGMAYAQRIGEHRHLDRLVYRRRHRVEAVQTVLAWLVVTEVDAQGGGGV